MVPLTKQEREWAIIRQTEAEAEKHRKEFYRTRRWRIKASRAAELHEVIALVHEIAQLGSAGVSIRDTYHRVEYALKCIETGRYATANYHLLIAACQLILLLRGADLSELRQVLHEKGLLMRPTTVSG